MTPIIVMYFIRLHPIRFNSLIHITLRVIPDNKRYTILSDKNTAAIYKRYLTIFYIRVSRVYEGYEIWTEVINEYDKLTK